MPKAYELSNPPSMADTVFYECDACGFSINVLDRKAPQGGDHHSPATVIGTDSVTGKTFYDLSANDAGQGCPGCGCPRWRSGGRLGDMGRGGW